MVFLNEKIIRRIFRIHYRYQLRSFNYSFPFQFIFQIIDISARILSHPVSFLHNDLALIL